MNPTKAELRKTLKKARLALSETDRQFKATAIAGRLLQAINWPEVASVHCFEPIIRLGEVGLTDFITALQTDREDIKVYTSREIDGVWQVVSTDTDKPVAVPKFDVVIVPMLGFDESLQRIGYGGGYYDRFLAGQPNAKKIGVCYEIGKIDHVPAEPHDVALDMVVTEGYIL